MSAKDVTPPKKIEASFAGDHEDRILPGASDLVGIFHVIRFGKELYAQLGLALALIFASSGAVMFSARTLGSLVTALSQHQDDRVVRLSLIFMSLELASVVAQYYGRVLLAKATIEITFRIRCELFAKIERLPIRYFDAQPLGRTITRVTADVEGIETFFNGTLARVMIALINLVTVLMTMFLLDAGFGSLILMASIPALLSTVAFRKSMRHWLRDYKKKSAHINSKLAEFLGGLPVIRAFGLEQWSKKEYDQAAQEMLSSGLMVMTWNSVVRPIALFLCSVPTLLVLWYGGQEVLTGGMALGTLVAFVRLSERFVSPVRTLSHEIQNIQEALVSSERVRRMLEEPEEDDVLGPDGVEQPTLEGALEYQQVGMRYGASGPWALQDISFKVTPGMKVGLVGATGSGKSTTLNLIPRFYPFQMGQILLDGIPIQKIKREHLRAQLGFVGQDPVITAGTIRSNLLGGIGRGVATDEQTLILACQKTGLDMMVASWGEGLDHPVVDGGDNLSMGQRQLIALTRMLLRNPRILILDEATANVDEKMEKLIQQATDEVMAGRTTFVIAHRLSTIVQSDLILVFRDGRLVEQGTDGSLRALGGYYKQLTLNHESEHHT